MVKTAVVLIPQLAVAGEGTFREVAPVEHVAVQEDAEVELAAGDDGVALAVEDLEGEEREAGASASHDANAAAAAAAHGLPVHAAPVRDDAASVDAAWTGAAARAEQQAAASGLGDGRPDFSATAWGSSGVGTRVPGKSPSKLGGGRIGMPALASHKPRVNPPELMSWPWKELGDAQERAACAGPGAAGGPPAAKRRVNMLKPLGGVGGKAGGLLITNTRLTLCSDDRARASARAFTRKVSS